MVDLDGLEMYVSSTASNGVVGSDTRLRFTQRGDRVVARYSGGNVARGWLAGRVQDASLVFRYLQRESGDGIHGAALSVEWNDWTTDGRRSSSVSCGARGPVQEPTSSTNARADSRRSSGREP